MEYNPLPSLRRMGNAQSCMLRHLRAMMNSRRSELLKATEGNHPTYRDVLGSLVAAQIDENTNQQQDPGTGLTEDEVIGNIFIFVV
jgi:hypothetical protein